MLLPFWADAKAALAVQQIKSLRGQYPQQPMIYQCFR